MLTFEELAKANYERNEKYFKEFCGNWDAVDWSNALCGEAGEYANFTKKKKRNMKPSDNIPKEELGKELADVILYACLAAIYSDINLEEAVKQKFNEVSDEIGCDIKL